MDIYLLFIRTVTENAHKTRKGLLIPRPQKCIVGSGASGECLFTDGAASFIGLIDLPFSARGKLSRVFLL